MTSFTMANQIYLINIPIQLYCIGYYLFPLYVYLRKTRKNFGAIHAQILIFDVN